MKTVANISDSIIYLLDVLRDRRGDALQLLRDGYLLDEKGATIITRDQVDNFLQRNLKAGIYVWGDRKITLENNVRVSVNKDDRVTIQIIAPNSYRYQRTYDNASEVVKIIQRTTFAECEKWTNNESENWLREETDSVEYIDMQTLDYDDIDAIDSPALRDVAQKWFGEDYD